MSKELADIELEELLNDTNYKFSSYYVYRGILGKGAFGVVVHAISKKTLEEMAVKVFFTRSRL